MATYEELKKILNKDIHDLKIDHKKLKSHELSVYNLLIGRNNMAQFNMDGETILLARGDSGKGLRHILERHYCQYCSGWVNARDIIYMGRIFLRGHKMTDAEIKDEYSGKEGYSLVLNDVKHVIIYGVDSIDKMKKIISYYSDRQSRCKEKEKETDNIAEPVALH